MQFVSETIKRKIYITEFATTKQKHYQTDLLINGVTKCDQTCAFYNTMYKQC